MARGARPAPATEGKTPAKDSRMSIRAMSGRESDFAGGRLTSLLPSPQRQPDALPDRAQETGANQTEAIWTKKNSKQ